MAPGPSVTAVCVAALRATYDCAPPPLRIVHDPFARKLIPRPLARIIALTESRPRLAHALHRALAIVTRELSTNLPLRTAAIDDALRSALRVHPTQVVLLGAGLDARAWRMPELAPCAVFEVDRPGAHRVKRRRLAGSTPHPRSHHTLAVDFEQQTVADALLPAGFDPSAATVWLWEAVTMYLTRAAIDRALDGIADLSGP
ncbi:MAG: SAM-dependent methyltransferase, partial [Candidatus Riflebacteria bacterium HGW-Riflebacteria-2]